MLITGGSRGIGKAIADYFSHSLEYDVVTVSRSENTTENGDLTNDEFRNYVVNKYTPYIFINNAGIISESFKETNNINYNVAGELLARFYYKMSEGHIINIGSVSGNLQGFGMSHDRIWYAASKNALQNLGSLLHEAAANDVKVTNLELGSVSTTIKNRFHGKYIPKEEYQEQTMRTIPMKTEDVANTVEWILNQPNHIVIPTITLTNFVKGKK